MSLAEPQKLIRSLEDLERVARVDWAKPGENFHLSMDDRESIKKRLQWCIKALRELSDRLENPI
jgi:hypothetical protein